MVSDDEGGIEVICEPGEFEAERKALEGAGLEPEIAEITMRPESTTVLTGEDAAKMQKLLEGLEALDDVQQVYTNVEFDETATA